MINPLIPYSRKIYSSTLNNISRIKDKKQYSYINYRKAINGVYWNISNISISGTDSFELNLKDTSQYTYTYTGCLCNVYLTLDNNEKLFENILIKNSCIHIDIDKTNNMYIDILLVSTKKLQITYQLVDKNRQYHECIITNVLFKWSEITTPKRESIIFNKESTGIKTTNIDISNISKSSESIKFSIKLDDILIITVSTGDGFTILWSLDNTNFNYTTVLDMGYIRNLFYKEDTNTFIIIADEGIVYYKDNIEAKGKNRKVSWIKKDVSFLTTHKFQIAKNILFGSGYLTSNVSSILEKGILYRYSLNGIDWVSAYLPYDSTSISLPGGNSYCLYFHECNNTIFARLVDYDITIDGFNQDKYNQIVEDSKDIRNNINNTYYCYWTSQDGINWTFHNTLEELTSRILSFNPIYFNNKYFLFSTYQSGYISHIFSSSDFNTWIEETDIRDSNNNSYSLGFATYMKYDNHIIAISTDKGIYFSWEGTTWRLLENSKGFTKFILAGGKLIACNGTIIRSWSSTNFSTPYNDYTLPSKIYSSMELIYTRGIWYILYDTKCYYSYNGIDWNEYIFTQLEDSFLGINLTEENSILSLISVDTNADYDNNTYSPELIICTIKSFFEQEIQEVT